MKIESHDIAMQSKHTAYKSIIESKMSFTTFFTDTEMEGIENLQKANKPQELQVDFASYFEQRATTLQGIIQNLIKMIQEKKNTPAEANQEIHGYHQVSFYEKYEEYESLDFSTKGHIKTDKGCLDINVNFSMSRSFVLENRIDIFTAFDPLVINLDGGLPNLLSDTFSFDLDNDGASDQISKLASGNGFLALDKNKDGKVNQGSELFGTLTGNGFGELSVYDEDKNSWIDENDSIFDSLQIWLKNEDNNKKELVGLGEAGIGAIYLNSASSEFSYKTVANNVLGELKSSGLFLKENGEVGNISQIDFSAQKQENAKETKNPLATLLQA